MPGSAQHYSPPRHSGGRYPRHNQHRGRRRRSIDRDRDRERERRMSDEDTVSYSPDIPRFSASGAATVEENLLADYHTARNTRVSTVSSERQEAFTNICETACNQQNLLSTRKDALSYLFELFSEFGTTWAANRISHLLNDPTTNSEIHNLIIDNAHLIISKATSGSFDALISTVAGSLSSLTPPSSQVHLTALYLAKHHPENFFGSVFSSTNIERGSLKWIARSYPQLKSEVFPDYPRTEGELAKHLNMASARLNEIVNKAITALDALGSIKPVLEMWSELLKVPGEAGIMIVGMAMDSLQNQTSHLTPLLDLGRRDSNDHLLGDHNSIAPVDGSIKDHSHSAPVTPLKREFEGSQGSSEAKRTRYDHETNSPRAPRDNRLPPRGAHSGANSGPYRGGYQGRNYVPGYRTRGNGGGGGSGGARYRGAGGGDYYRSHNSRARYTPRESDHGSSRAFHD
ncbi:hypothetical protein L873DRAFT_831833 [Choiromyces venosus 120613-1]|uniref:Uncharacterized protein n=1 Tax=Choiromyces venosus 120613-1 TaxID=1336337 RepID=A0A3N4JPN3_9PEZI|nr:hypothetical protein L873DRAFT_831833 [Choiromyces venosus 120613-1]